MPISPLVLASGLSDATEHTVASSASFRPLSPRATEEEKRVWNGNLPAAQRLFARLQSTIHEDHLARQASIANPHAPQTPVNPRTLLKQGDGRSDLAGMQLHANWIMDGNILMAVPRYGEAMAWAKACFEHDIGAIVSLGTQAEHDKLHPCMENDRPIVANGRQVEFAYPDGGDGPGKAAADLIAAHSGTFTGPVQINMGKPDVERPDARHEVSSYTIPIPTDQAIRPGILLATCRMLHDETSGRPTAFQSPEGDHRGAVFAAAHGLYQQFAKGELDAHNLEQRVVQQCIDLRAARSATLFDRPDHLASLLTMGKMMLADGRPKSMGTPVAMRTPKVVSAPAEAPPRSAMKGARARALTDAAPRSAVQFTADTYDNERVSNLPDVPQIWSDEELVQVRQNPSRKPRP